MARNLSNVNVGTAPNDGSGDLLRDAFVKVNQNITGIYQNGQFLANTTDSLSVPGFSWESDKNTGIFHPEDGVVGVSLNGLEGLLMRANGYIGWRGGALATISYVQSQINGISGGGTGTGTGTGSGGLTGIPVVDELPSSGNFEGRLVILNDDGLIYIYQDGAWVKLKDILATDTKTGIETVSEFPSDPWEGRTVIKDGKLWIYINGVWTDLIKYTTPNAPKGVEIWTATPLPTTDNFNGRVVLWVAPNGDDRLWVYRTSSSSWVHMDEYLTPDAAGTGIPTGTSLPTSGMSEGDFFYNTTNRTLYVYTNGSWKTLGEYLGVTTIGIRTVATLEGLTGSEGDLVIYNDKIYIYKDGAWTLLAETLTPDANGNIEIVDDKDTLTDNWPGRTVLNRADNGLYIFVDGVWRSFQQYITANASAINGVEIVAIPPSSIETGLFDGKIVFYTGDEKLYIYTTATGWTLLSTYLAPDAPTGIEIVPALPSSGNYEGRTVIQGGAVYYYNGTEYVLLSSLITPAATGAAMTIVSTVAGLAGTEGQVVFNTSDNKIYEYTSGAWAEVNFTITASADVANGSITTAKFASGLTPVEIITTETLPSTGLYTGRIAYWNTTGQLHRYNGTTWTNATPNTSITGTLTSDQIQAIANTKILGTITTTQIGPNAITSAKIEANAINASHITAGTITGDKIAANTIGANQIAANAITADELSANAVTAGKIAAGAIVAGTIAAGAITATELAANAVTTAKLNAGAITAEKIAANAITAEKINAGAITTEKLLANAITAAKIAAGAIGADQIAANAITSDKLIANAITAAKIAAGAIGATQISASAITSDKIATGAITAAKVSAGAIGATEIAANAISSDKILANAITAGKIAAGAITATQIAANTITADKFAVGAISAVSVTAGSITTDKLAANAVTADKILANAITAGKIAAGAIGATQISANAVTAQAIAADSITAAKIAAGAIGTDELAANSITADKIVANNITAVKIAAGAITTDKIAANAITTAKISPLGLDGNIIVDGTLEVNALKGGVATLTGGTFSLGACTSLKTGNSTYYAIGVFESNVSTKFGLIVSSTTEAPAFAAAQRAGRNAGGAAAIFVRSNGTTYEGSYSSSIIFNETNWAIAGSKRPNADPPAGATYNFADTAFYIGSTSAAAVFQHLNGTSNIIRSYLTLSEKATNGDFYTIAGIARDTSTAGYTKANYYLGWDQASGSYYGGVYNNYYASSGSQGITKNQAVLAYDEGTGALQRGGARFTAWNTSGTIVSAVYIATNDGRSIYTAAGTAGPFTGSHDAYIDPTVQFEIGDIVKDVQTIAKKSINDVITKVALTDGISQKAVVGVISLDNGINNPSPPTAVSDEIEVVLSPATEEKILYNENGQEIIPAKAKQTTTKLVVKPEYRIVHENLRLIHINSIGEGLVNVCGQNGNIEAGDLIMSSSILGKGMKQPDDIIRSYTVAKARESVTFSSLTEVKQVACTYLCG